MKSPDPASLQNLNDIVLPSASSWWPLASGWYVLSGLLIVGIAWFSYRSLKRWFSNRYRRAALHELQLLTESSQNTASRDSSLRRIPVLLKRAALSTYPRKEVACLSGKNWHRFLNSTTRAPLFSETTLVTLDKISYSGGKLSELDTQAITDLLKACRQWLKHHVNIHHSINGGET